MSGFFNSLRNLASGAAYAASSASKYEELEVEDTKMRFSLTPQPGESGFIQWLDAMKMVASLPGGIPPEFRRKLWLTLAERHLEQRGVDWKQAEKICFNEWSNPDDEELGIQIVKDLHRTGCSLFCGAAGRDNQAVLRRVLLGFARWNKSVGYCQGLNVLAALVLQVMDRAESAAVKVMIYLIEGVLPEGYFADNLRGLSVDMAVFRDLLRGRLPKLSKHLEALQNDAKDKATGSSYEPPLTNVFTMQWFLTLFCHCLPQEAVLRVWDLIFLEGDEILLRTALAIWDGLSDRIMTVTSADEFYSIMGVLTREMLEFTDTNNLIKNIVSMGPLHGVTGLREKHRYNITPWARKLSDDDDSDTEEDERLAVAAAMFSMAQRLKKDRFPQTLGALQAIAPSSDRERIALDISTLKQQYAKLRERQRQAHIILSAACARQTMVPPPTSQAMNHLLVGKNALVSGKNRPLGLPSATPPTKTRPTTLNQNRKDKQGVTLHWKDTKKLKMKASSMTGTAEATIAAIQPSEIELPSPKRSSGDSDSDSTSTELCDEPDRLSDVDSEDLTSTSDSYVMAKDDEKRSRLDGSPIPAKTLDDPSSEEKKDSTDVTDSQETKTSEENFSDMSIAKITDQIRRLSAEDDNNSMVPREFSVQRSESPDDLSTKELEKEKSPDLPIDYTSDNIVKSSLALDEYDYLSFTGSIINSKEDEVLVHESHRSKQTTDETVSVPQEDFAEVKLEEEESTSLKQDTSYTDYTTSSDTKYDNIVDKPVFDLDSESEIKADRPRTSFDFSTRVSLYLKPYKSSETESVISDLSGVSEGTTYCKAYVGHIPISPVTVDQKLSELSPTVHATSDIMDLTSEIFTKPETITEKMSYSNEIQTKIYSDLSPTIHATNKMSELISDTSTKSEIITENTSYSDKIQTKIYSDLSPTIHASNNITELITETKPETTTEKTFYSDRIQMKIYSDLSPTIHATHNITELVSETSMKPETITEKTFYNERIQTKIYSDLSPTIHATNNITGVISETSTKPGTATEKTSYSDRVQMKIYSDLSPTIHATHNITELVSETSMKPETITEKTFYNDRIQTKIYSDLSPTIHATNNITELVSGTSTKPEIITEKTSYCDRIQTNIYSDLSPTIYTINNITGLISETSTKPETVAEKSYSDKIQTKMYSDLVKSPKTPESNKSFSSCETMGPDSKPSSLVVSPRTPVKSDSRDFSIEKSACSSVSSDSKTLVLRSIDSDSTKDSTKPETKRIYEMSNSATPITIDSLKSKSDVSPKLVVSSSSDSCSPGKLKSSERSFSSDLQSPISANSIKYTSNFNRRGQDDVSDPSMDLSSATSPFYPISNPNQKTPTSPYSASRRKSSLDSTETSPEQKSTSSRDSTKFLNYQSKFDTSLKAVDFKDMETASRKGEDFIKPEFTVRKEDSCFSEMRNKEVSYYQATSSNYYLKDKDAFDDGGDDPLSEKDVVPSLPQEKLDKHYLNYRYKDRSKLLERSSSSLDSRRYADMKLSASIDEFSTSIAKKRSSDILEDIKHLEAKANDGSSESGMLTQKSSYIWEDMKCLEARRQDTFSNSASTFSKRRLEIPDISITGEGRKSYIVHPRMNIDENSDSILKTVACCKSDNDSDDGRESKLGVWTKVKPRKKGDNGRRNSDRALKIIQENSAILQKILACQAKKRLPDLEEISKEITISPINEEISKIFSPILEKMGLNEHEINEELARINFKDFDNMTATSVSEFDAKINEELSKLSLIDESEQMDHFDVDDVIAHEYLDTREALIDRKINEELSKLLANYDDHSPASMVTRDKRPPSQNISEIDRLDLSSISTNMFSYKSSNDSIDTRSDLSSTQEPSISVDKFPKYTDNVLPYAVTKYQVDDSSPKSDIDIYWELEKLDKISSAQVLPEPTLELPQKEISSIPYVSETSPFKDTSPLRYTSKSVQYDTSPLKSSYDPYKTFDFKPKLSPKHVSTNPFVTAAYDKPVVDTTFEYINHKPDVSINTYDLHLKSPLMTKESLEFRVRYDEDPTRDINTDYMSLQSDARTIVTAIKSPYFSNGNTEPLTPTKYISKDERCLDTAGGSFLDYTSEPTDILRRKYDPLSPKEYSHTKSIEYDRRLSALPPLGTDTDAGSYLSTRHRDYHPLSPSPQFPDQHFPSAINHYASKLSPSSLSNESKRPVSHPEFPGKLNVGKYAELPEIGSSAHKNSSLSLGNIGHSSSKDSEDSYNTVTSPKTRFSPFPVRKPPRKPKELTLKLGLYSPNSDVGQLKKS